MFQLKQNPSATDEHLVAEYLNTNDQEALSQLYARYFGKVCQKCRTFADSDTEASDLAQDIMLKVISRISSFRNGARFGTWVYAVAHNHCLDYARKARKRRLTVAWDNQRDLADDRDDLESLRRLEWMEAQIDVLLAMLPEEERRLIVLKYRENKSIRELQELTGLNASAMKMKLLRVRKKLRDMFGMMQEPEQAFA